ncbi:exonuclease SbcC [Runella defluvii]|uniref:Exonuclease SbcC n=1 Tax=Runella defluvii TaxID=370973 RepID=A0A7W6ESY9_9BACT|nr:SMC family ATPase [Runella defluvii]MBB3841199.1 exonuclease SbcC [Runella defluvii]
MIPIKLILQGIQSYRERQEIDFTQLTEAKLFGIFGKVGSGKSTILEAITFVLYGDSERLNSRENRSYNLMNLRSEKLFIDLVFRTGRDQTEYRFVAEGKRSGKHFDQVKIERKAFQWMPELEDWAPIAAENPAEKIIGLSYENFKRTVIIPQGRFQEFIELRDADRTRMMKELFQLERFELSERVKRLLNKTESEWQHVEGQRKAIGDVTQEMYEQTKLDLQNAHGLLAQHKEQLDQKQREEKTIEALIKLFNRLVDVEGEIKKLEEQTERFQNRRVRLQQYERCQLEFKPLLDKKNDVIKQINREVQAQVQIQNQIDTAEKALIINQNEVEKLRPSYEKRQDSQVEIEDLRIIIHTKKAEAERTKLLKRMEDGRQKLVLRQSALLERKTQYETLKKQRVGLREVLPDVAQLLEIKAWFDKKEALLKDKENLRARADELVKKESGVAETKLGLFTDELQTLIEKPVDGQTFDAIYESIEAARLKLQKEAEALNPDILHLNTQKALQQYAGALQEGEPCPLCGAVHHPHILTAETNFNGLIHQLQQRQEQLKNTASQTLGQLEKQLRKVEKELTSIQSQKLEVRQNWERKTEEIRLHETQFSWPTFENTDRKPIDVALELAKKTQEQLALVDKQLDVEEQGIQKDETELKEKYEKPIEEFGQKVAAFDGAIQQSISQLKVLEVQQFVSVEVAGLENQADKQAQELQNVVLKFEEFDKKIRQLQQEIGPLTGQLTSSKTNLENFQTEAKKAESRIVEALERYQYESETIVLEVLGWQLDLAQERELIAAFDQNLFAFRKEREDLLQVASAQTIDQERYKQLLTEIEEHQQTIERWTREQGRLVDLEKTQALQLQKQAELLDQKAKLELRQADLKTLEKLFKASGFVNYVSSVYLQNLCNQANDRFHRMTRQQLQLEVNENNNFQVRDLLNDGRTRALNTLSGGQKFQAALSLALALADNVNTQIEAKENFFFLDEGFGSLDKESLQTVFDTLKSLRKENRVVGVISHVEDLQQEIDCYLRVTNDEERGSLLTLL